MVIGDYVICDGSVSYSAINIDKEIEQDYNK